MYLLGVLWELIWALKQKKFIAVLLSYLSIFVNSVDLSQLPKTSLFEGTEKAFYVDTQAKNLCLSHDGILGNHLWTILPFCWGWGWGKGDGAGWGGSCLSKANSYSFMTKRKHCYIIFSLGEVRSFHLALWQLSSPFPCLFPPWPSSRWEKPRLKWDRAASPERKYTVCR